MHVKTLPELVEEASRRPVSERVAGKKIHESTVQSKETDPFWVVRNRRESGAIDHALRDGSRISK
jgi:hypothetical protein